MNSQVLGQIAAVLESRDSRPAKAQRIAAIVRRAGHYRWVGVYSVEAGEIANLAWSGPAAPAHPRFPIGQGLCGAAVHSARAVIANDVTRDPRYLTTLGTTRSEIVVPVLASASGDVLGLLDVESERINAFTDAERVFLEGCAAALARLWNGSPFAHRPERESRD